jgi:hypothetical protein
MTVYQTALLPKIKQGIQEFELTVRFKLCVHITDVAKN